MNCEICKYHDGGLCRRYPPVVVCLVGSDNYGGTTSHTEEHLPYTTDEDWCGEWKPKGVDNE